MTAIASKGKTRRLEIESATLEEAEDEMQLIIEHSRPDHFILFKIKGNEYNTPVTLTVGPDVSFNLNFFESFSKLKNRFLLWKVR